MDTPAGKQRRIIGPSAQHSWMGRSQTLLLQLLLYLADALMKSATLQRDITEQVYAHLGATNNIPEPCWCSGYKSRETIDARWWSSPALASQKPDELNKVCCGPTPCLYSKDNSVEGNKLERSNGYRVDAARTAVSCGRIVPTEFSQKWGVAILAAHYLTHH